MKNLKNNLIGIAGKMNSGKDLTGKILQHLFSEWAEDEFKDTDMLPFRSDYQIKKFADKLKDMVCLLIGCTREQLEDEEFKNKELGEEWWYYVRKYPFEVCKEDYVLFNYLEWKTKLSSNYILIKLTPRKLMQLLGTECGRQIIHPNIWVNALFADYVCDDCGQQECPTDEEDTGQMIHRSFPDWIITDVRFPNEAQAIKDRGGVIIRVNRPCSECGVLTGHKMVPHKNSPSTHPSETALDSYDFDYVIDNDKDIEHLIKQVKEII